MALEVLCSPVEICWNRKPPNKNIPNTQWSQCMAVQQLPGYPCDTPKGFKSDRINGAAIQIIKYGCIYYEWLILVVHNLLVSYVSIKYTMHGSFRKKQLFLFSAVCFSVEGFPQLKINIHGIPLSNWFTTQRSSWPLVWRAANWWSWWKTHRRTQKKTTTRLVKLQRIPILSWVKITLQTSLKALDFVSLTSLGHIVWTKKPQYVSYRIMRMYYFPSFLYG